MRPYRRTGRLRLVIIVAVVAISVLMLPVAVQGAGEELRLQYDNPQPDNSPSMLSQLVRLIVSLALIVGLALVLIRLFGRRVINKPSAGWLNVIDQVALAPNKGIYLTEIAGRYYVLGVTDHQINKLTEIENPDLITDLQPLPHSGAEEMERQWWKRFLPRPEKRSQQPMEFHAVMEEQLRRMKDLKMIFPMSRRPRNKQ